MYMGSSINDKSERCLEVHFLIKYGEVHKLIIPIFPFWLDLRKKYLAPMLHLYSVDGKQSSEKFGTQLLTFRLATAGPEPPSAPAPAPSLRPLNSASVIKKGFNFLCPEDLFVGAFKPLSSPRYPSLCLTTFYPSSPLPSWKLQTIQVFK